MWPKYLNSVTNCKDLSPNFNAGNMSQTILLRHFGENTMHTVFLMLHIKSISQQHCDKTSNSYCNANHEPAVGFINFYGTPHDDACYLFVFLPR